MNTLKVLFPALMVCGALGSLLLSAIEGDAQISLQWFGAACLYTALMFRNIGG